MSQVGIFMTTAYCIEHTSILINRLGSNYNLFDKLAPLTQFFIFITDYPTGGHSMKLNTSDVG
jgi:hypothetical protein